MSKRHLDHTLSVLGVCVLCVGCALDWSNSWPTPRGEGDRGHDAPPADRAVPSDGLQAERLLHLGPCNARASVAPDVAEWQLSMRTCTSTTAFDQCSAGASCNTEQGWHLCTSAEYADRGGVNNGPRPSARPAWIAGYVRHGVIGEALTVASACPTCYPSSTLTSLVLHATCNNLVPGPAWPQPDVGVVASDTCHLLVKDPYRAMWETLPAATKLKSVVCCR